MTKIITYALDQAFEASDTISNTTSVEVFTSTSIICLIFENFGKRCYI
jgi:hypothetical protein